LRRNRAARRLRPGFNFGVPRFHSLPVPTSSGPCSNNGANQFPITPADPPGALLPAFRSLAALSFSENGSREEDEDLPSAVHLAMVEAASRTWKQLAKERIEDTEPSIPLGKRFWPITAAEKKAIEKLFEIGHVHGLATMLRSRDDDAPVVLLDAAYWMKGCSSLGLLRFAVLLGIGKKKDRKLCLMDVKEAAKAAAPRYRDAKSSTNGAVTPS
jgi:hypothetical protein